VAAISRRREGLVLWLHLAVCRATGSGTVVGRREELRLADGVRHWGRVVERDWGDVWSERNGGGLGVQGPAALRIVWENATNMNVREGRATEQRG
jgi:hypothetical protein